MNEDHSASVAEFRCRLYETALDIVFCSRAMTAAIHQLSGTSTSTPPFIVLYATNVLTLHTPFDDGTMVSIPLKFFAFPYPPKRALINSESGQIIAYYADDKEAYGIDGSMGIADCRIDFSSMDWNTYLEGLTRNYDRYDISHI